MPIRLAEDDPLLVFLRRINGKVMRPVEHKPKAIEETKVIEHDAPPPSPAQRGE